MQDETVRLPAMPTSVLSARRHALVGALAAAILGMVIVWTVGFSEVEAIHNAAHDTRHSHAFPCH